jgi:type VI secretion system Hcp family effector
MANQDVAACTFKLKNGGANAPQTGRDVNKEIKNLKGFEVYNVFHGITSSTDAATGQRTGQRQHKLLELVGPAAPYYAQLAMAVCTGDQVDELKLTTFVTSQGEGKRVPAIEITLTMATVAYVTLGEAPCEAGNAKKAGQFGKRMMVRMGFAYDKISGVFYDMDGKEKKEFADSWTGA